MSRKRVVPKFKSNVLSQSDMITGIESMTPNSTILEYRGDGIWKTSAALKKMGVAVCSDCGHITSDQNKTCPGCGNEIFII